MMAENKPKRKLKPIEVCPNGHHYNAGKYGDTCAVCGVKLDLPEDLPEEEVKELTHIDEQDWVCGWLVCIKGPNKGRGYPIKEGKNFIGSASVMDIQILGDKKIDKKNHAAIMYDPRKNTTMLLPSDSHGMVYWRGAAIFEPVTIKSFDSIEIGESIFKYAPFCGEDFEWKDAEKEGEK